MTGFGTGFRRTGSVIVATSQADQRAAGHWGVPMMVFAGEPFFGQDRFDQLKWRLEAQGLQRRNP